MITANDKFKNDLYYRPTLWNRLEQSLKKSLTNGDQTITNGNSKRSKRNFDDITITDLGLIIEYKNKKFDEITFSDLQDSYVKKLKLSTSIKLLFVLFSAVVLIIVIKYFPMLIVVILGILILLFIKMNNFKWYEFILVGLDGSYYRKRFFVNSKQAHVSLVKIIKREIFDHRVL